MCAIDEYLVIVIVPVAHNLFLKKLLSSSDQ